MKKIENIWNYFFSLNGSLNQKKYIIHYFLDLLLFVIICILLFVFTYFLAPTFAQIKIFELRLPIFILFLSVIVLLSLLIMNRLSIVIRRLSFLKMKKLYSLLVLIPLVGIIFEIYLLLQPDEVI